MIWNGRSPGGLAKVIVPHSTAAADSCGGFLVETHRVAGQEIDSERRMRRGEKVREELRHQNAPPVASHSAGCRGIWSDIRLVSLACP